MSKFLENRAEIMFSKIQPFLRRGDNVLDIGCGSCHVVKKLKKEGYVVVPLDVKNKSRIKGIKPTIYNGKELPFNDDSFDVALLLTVLHHIRNPVQILSEATRVAPRIIVMEDLYKGTFQKYLTFLMDSMLNIEFIGHPHSNKTQKEWKNVFKELNLIIISEKAYNFWRFFTSGIFYLERK